MFNHVSTVFSVLTLQLQLHRQDAPIRTLHIDVRGLSGILSVFMYGLPCQFANEWDRYERIGDLGLNQRHSWSRWANSRGDMYQYGARCH